jgi:hypothetical protein
MRDGDFNNHRAKCFYPCAHCLRSLSCCPIRCRRRRYVLVVVVVVVVVVAVVVHT